MLFAAVSQACGRARRLLGGGLLGALILAFSPAVASAALFTYGSPLSAPATLDTASNLSYVGTNTAVPPSPEAPSGNVHTYHYGADTALWSSAGVPVAGQALQVRLEGCAKPAEGGPAPLTQIHFQDISPLPGGGAKVNITSQGFEIPVCGQGGAGSSTVSTYEPVNLCVSAGDYVDFNDEGGYVENVYRNGVPYRVLGAVSGSTTDSFLLDNGTGNGATLSPSLLNANYGFASNANEELMMQVTLGTGSDATHICAGGTAGLPPALAPVRVSPQTDGVNHERIVAVAVYCRVSPKCTGVATLTLGGKQSVGRSSFSLTPNTTSHLPIRVSPKVIDMIRRYHGVTATLTAVVAGQTITQKISVKIF